MTETEVRPPPAGKRGRKQRMEFILSHLGYRMEDIITEWLEQYHNGPMDPLPNIAGRDPEYFRRMAVDLANQIFVNADFRERLMPCVRAFADRQGYRAIKAEKAAAERERQQQEEDDG